MSQGQGYCTRAGNHANESPLFFLRGVLFEGDDYVIPSDVPSEHDKADIDYLAETDEAA